MKRTGPQCDSCRRPGATDHVIDGYRIVCCSECAVSPFSRERMVGRARKAEGETP